MAFRRGFKRRRRSRLRWFTPNLWNASEPQLYASTTVVAPGAEQAIAATLTPMVQGSAPFPGVVNAAGALAGKQLSELQYWNLLRAVGRMRWYFAMSSGADPFTFNEGGIVTVWWAFVRMNTDENGTPYEQGDGTFPSLSTRDNQDDKKLIIAQDVWRTDIPPGTVFLTGGTIFTLEGEPPLYSLIDKTMRRSFRNEQDLYLLVQATVFSHGNTIPAGKQISIHGLLNIRLLGRFGR